MKKVILFLVFMPVSLFSQVSENFETGNLNRWVENLSGHWKADSTGSISGKYSLHHVFDNPDTGNDQVGIPITNLKPSMGLTKWSFKIKHGYDPSSSNYWAVFLTSDNPPAFMIPGSSVNGFIIGVNLAGYDDTLRLWKIKNGILSVVLNTGINWQNEVGTGSPAIINVERSQTGRWKTSVFSKNLALIDSASTFNGELFNADWFGVYYKYTATRDRLLWIDDILIDGPFFEDKDPPKINKCTFDTYYSVNLFLDEEPVAEFFAAANFSLNDKPVTASNILKLSPLSVRVTFENTFINKSENTLFINSICDKSGNCIKDVSVKFTPAWAEQGDVIISEIMADPAPSVSLPEKEYIEIYNRTSFQFNLKKWKLSDEGSGTVFPETIINPTEQMILCQIQDTSFFLRFGKVRGLKSFPSLTDAGKLIVLYDSLGKMIHGVEYCSEWNRDDLKKEGGWSLEMIDTNFPFYNEGNWIASISKAGGTPGGMNSVQHLNRDKYFKGIINVFPTDSNTLKIYFSEPVRNFTENSKEIKIDNSGVKSVFSTDQLLREYTIIPGSQFIRTKKYLLEIPSGIKDFAGNSPMIKSSGFGIPEKPVKGEIVFNEILFNPRAGDADYIELYNASNEIIDAYELSLSSVSESGVNSEPVHVSAINRCILPGTFYVITTKKESVLNRYLNSVPDNIFQVSALPSMPDNNGHLILFNRQLDIIDEVAYNEKMHYSLLSGYEGIALEKIRPSASSKEPGNWYSASETYLWGTPGAPNSIASIQPISDKKIVFSSTKITPDNDGYEDLLIIDLNLNGNSNVISATVFDESGGFVRKIAENLLSGQHTTIIWNGSTNDGSIVNSGIYIILISVFDDTGRGEKWKKVCAVIR
jgi:hypothetical protein